MITKKVAGEMNARVTPDQIVRLQFHMQRLAERNPSWGIAADNWPVLYQYLAAKKITYLYDDELFEQLIVVDHRQTGKAEELLDAYMVLDTGDEIQLKLFQFKFTEKYDGGISTKELYAFVDRMNRVFLRGDLEDVNTLEAYREVREAFKTARDANRRAKSRIHCYYVVNGQNVSITDRAKVDELRDIFKTDRQSYGFTFETYGALDVFNLCEIGRVPIQDEVVELNHDTGPQQYLHHNIGANPNGMPIQIRAEDLVANDPPQVRLQTVFRDYGVGYEREEGETLPQLTCLARLSKESAAMAFMAVFWRTYASRLRNSASRKVFFSRSDEYYKVFGTMDESTAGAAEAVQLTLASGEVIDLVPATQRAMEILAAFAIETVSRKAIAETPDKKRRGSLRKAAYFVSRLIYLDGKKEIDAQITKAVGVEPNPNDARKLHAEVSKVAIRLFPAAVKRFDEGLKTYIAKSGGDEDAALKNTAFAESLER